MAPSREDRSPKPSGRLAEGIVIVISILLAFGIDALWAQRQTRADEGEALAALASDFEANRAQAEEIVAGHRMARDRMETLVRLSEAELEDLTQLQVSQIMLSTCNPWRFDPVVGTLDALISSGQLGILRHAPLREALTTFRNLVADAAGDAAFMDALALDVWRAEPALGGPWTDPATERGVGEVVVTSPDYIPLAQAADLIRIRENQDFMGLASRCHINIGYYLADLERIHAQTIAVLDLVEESR